MEHPSVSLSTRLKYLKELSLLHGGSKRITEDFNIFWQFKLFSQRCTSQFTFWAIVAVCAVAEPILCSYYPTTINIFIQTLVLAASTFLYIVQLIGVASTEWEKIIVIEALSGFESVNVTEAVKNFTPLKLLIFYTAEGEYILEGIMLTLGWILLFWHPGLAALRCFRVFRLLWFYEVEAFRYTVVYRLSPIFGEAFMVRLFKILKFSIKALTALGNEMFRLTNETRGGLLLMMLFFYSAYVLGITLWIETNGNIENCYSGPSCTYVLMRLTFFDGNGFDFAYALTHDYRILFIIVMGYLCITSFGILNGLVGIFGTAFARASHIAFDDPADHLPIDEYEDPNQPENPAQEATNGRGGDDNSGGENHHSEHHRRHSSPQKISVFEATEEGDNEDGSESSFEEESRREDRPGMKKGSMYSAAGESEASGDDGNNTVITATGKAGGGGGGGEDDDDVHAFEDQKDIPPMLASKITSARNLLNPTAIPMDRTEIKQKVKAIFRGNSSRFAVEHIKRTQKQQFVQQQIATASGWNLKNLTANETNTNTTNTNTNTNKNKEDGNGENATATSPNKLTSVGSMVSNTGANNAVSTPNSAAGTPNKKFNFKDIARRVSVQQHANVHPDGMFGGVGAAPALSPTQQQYRPKAARVDMMNMFDSPATGGGATTPVSLKARPSLAVLAASASQQNILQNQLTSQMSAMNDLTKEMKTMSTTMQEMHRLFDRQNEMIFHMYQHIHYLSHQLQVIHPDAKIDDKLPEFSIDMKKYKGPIITAPPPDRPKTAITTPAVIPVAPLPRGTTPPPRGIQNYTHRVQQQLKAAGLSSENLPSLAEAETNKNKQQQ